MVKESSCGMGIPAHQNRLPLKGPGFGASKAYKEKRLFPCKLIALDLDGTLLNSDKILTERSRAALEAAAGAGIEIVPATGRFYRGMPETIRALPFVHYAITINGAQVLDVRTGETLYVGEIPVEEALACFAFLDGLPVIYDCYVDGWGYMTASMQEKAEEYISNPHSLDMVLRLRSPVPELKAYLRERGKPLQKMQLFTRDIPLRDALLAELAERFPAFAVTTSLPNNIEINSRDADKGRALLGLAARLGISREKTMAFGDGLNDLTMLTAAGAGVAMGNASAELKAAAALVAPDCDHDGVARVIEQLLNE